MLSRILTASIFLWLFTDVVQPDSSFDIVGDNQEDVSTDMPPAKQPCCMPPNRKRSFSQDDDNYSPGKALQAALGEWLVDFQRPCGVSSPDGNVQPQGLATSEVPSTQAETTSQEMCSGMELERHSPETNLVLQVSLTLEQLNLFVDLLYLPFEHGHSGIRLLELFCWLLRFYHQFTPSDGEHGAVIPAPDLDSTEVGLYTR